MRNTGRETEFMNDIMKYDEITNEWIDVTPKSGDSPPPRHSHSMFCFYNYLFVFGGIGENDKIFGDLWAYDLIALDWIPILDSDKTHILEHEGVTGGLPQARYGSSGSLFPNNGAAVIIGGMTAQGVACDIWVMDLDYIVNYLERPDIYKRQNIWRSQELDEKSQKLTCRYSHTTGLVNPKQMFIFGGIDQDNNAMRSVFAYDFLKNDIIPLKETGTTMETRIGHGLLAIGNGMMLLYGGSDPQGRGQFSDIWHISVNIPDKKVVYTESIYKKKHDHYIMSWRQGFTLHWIRSLQDPVIVGGTFGNNQ